MMLMSTLLTNQRLYCSGRSSEVKENELWGGGGWVRVVGWSSGLASGAVTCAVTQGPCLEGLHGWFNTLQMLS